MAKKKTAAPTPEDTHTEPKDHWPALMDKLYHPDISKALQNVPFTPPRITHNSSQEEELEANEEAVFAAGCQLYEHLRRPHMQVDSVYKLINATRNFISLRRKYLNLERDDLSGAVPVKPKVTSLG